MQNLLRIVVAALIVLGIVAYMTTYSVRFTEVAVVTTFGGADAESVRTEPGLGFKWPYPIQTVTKYDTRCGSGHGPIRWPLSDDRQVVVTAFLTYRVKDPLKFLQSFGTAGGRASEQFAQADNALRLKLRSALGQVSKYRLSDLLSASAAGSKLPELESQIMQQLGDAASSGIEPLVVGISGIELPEATTKAVFDRMKATRQRIASEAVTRGQAARESTRADADAAAKKILDFAERRAAVIRSQGEAEAAQYYAQQKADPDLAVFLQQLDFLRNAYSKKKITLVIPVTTPGFGLMQPIPPTVMPQLTLPGGETTGGKGAK
ncbi:MAG: hypothetical protein KIT68_02750 [Phycisphaeraceae bacterium]|nr:hypothetical protein [Phycisphaeraceae bacterium]